MEGAEEANNEQERSVLSEVEEHSNHEGHTAEGMADNVEGTIGRIWVSLR